MHERLERVDEIIERSVRGEASAVETEGLAAWRRAALANERHYRQLVRLLGAARTFAPAARAVPPSVATILARAPHADESPRRSALWWTPWVVAVAAALVAAVAIEQRVSGGRQHVWGASDISTGASEMATVQLADGSIVRLAPRSRLRFGNDPSARDVTLDGRAFFVVAKLPDRPFVVHTPLGDARVLGTRFELTTAQDGLRLLVVEGRVALSAASNSVEVRGGEESGVRGDTALRPRAVPNAERMEQWVGRFLAFQATPLPEVAREVERLYGIRLVLADAVIAARTVKASFTDRPADEVIDALCTVVSARCESMPGMVVMSSK